MSDAQDLTKLLIYESIESSEDAIPPKDLKYIGITVTPIKKFDIIKEFPSLQIITLRLCSITAFPDEFFDLPNVRSIDLSGNQIKTITRTERWKKMTSLIHLNISENEIDDYKELKNLYGIPNLLQINFAGNPCVGEQDPLQFMTRMMPNILVINDEIILSQYKGALFNLAKQTRHGTLSLGKTDDFFFNYVKYMHIGGVERYIRKFNAEYFCLHRVIRKYSAIDKFQSIYRGYVKRVAYKKMRNSALRIQLQVKLWYKKRVRAANKIKFCFLYYQTRQKIRFIRAVRNVQSRWRAKMALKDAYRKLFTGLHGEDDTKASFYLSKTSLDLYNAFCDENGFQKPATRISKKYKMLREKEAKKLKLPGSPTIYYAPDDSLIIKKFAKPQTPKPSIWCNHSHDYTVCDGSTVNVNKFGVNVAAKCPFASIAPLRSNRAIKKVTFDYSKSLQQDLYVCEYDDVDTFLPILTRILLKPPQGIKIIPYMSLPLAAATVIIQNGCRTLLTRKKYFHKMKQKSIEKRAKAVITRFFRFIKITKAVRHIVKTIQFSRNLPQNSFYYVSLRFIEHVLRMNPLYPVAFGYNTERELVLAPGNDAVLTKFIPEGNISFREFDIHSLFKNGVSLSKATVGMFAEGTMKKSWIERYKIMRLSFSTVSEAAKRTFLFTWMTGLDNWCFTEDSLQELIAATKIKNAWVGHVSRAALFHIASQAGKKLNTKMFIFRTADERKNDQGVITINYTKSRGKKDLDCREAIARLRGDYRPWKADIDAYKEYLKTDSVLSPKMPSVKLLVPEESPSKKMLGLLELSEKDDDSLGQTKSHHNSPRQLTAKTVPSTVYRKTRNSLQSPLISRNQNRPTMTPKVLKRMLDVETEQDNVFAQSVLDTTLTRSIASSSQKKRAIVTPVSRSATSIQRTPPRPQVIATPAKPATFATGVFMPPPPKRELSSFSKARSTSRTQNTDSLSVSFDGSDSITQRSEQRTQLNLNPISNNTSNEGMNSSTTKIDSQRSDTSAQDHKYSTLIRLSRLHQIMDQVAQAQIIDNSLQERREATLKAQTQIVDRRLDVEEQQIEKLELTRARNTIEKQELKKDLQRQKEKEEKRRQTASQSLRKSIANKRDKFNRDKAFSIEFVSHSRNITQKTEKAQRQAEKRAEIQAAQESTFKERQRLKEARENIKQIVQDSKDMKLELARIDREIIHEKEEIAAKQAAERRERINTVKKDLKETERKVREIRESGVQYILPDTAPIVVKDENQEATDVIQHSIGSHMGVAESAILTDLMASL